MKRIILYIMIFIFAVGCVEQANVKEETVKTKTRDGIFIHISTTDPHRVSMALSLAAKMSEDTDVMVFCDIEGVNLLTKDAEEIQYGSFKPVSELLNNLTGKGILIEACPMCLKEAGKSEADLREGVKIADKKDFFSFTKGRILTIDY